MRGKAERWPYGYADRHGSSHRNYSPAHHNGEVLPAGRALQARRPCTAGMHTAEAWQAVRAAAVALLHIGSVLGNALYTSVCPDASRTYNAAPLKHYLVRSAARARGPSAPMVRPHCADRQGPAVVEPTVVLLPATAKTRIFDCVSRMAAGRRAAGPVRIMFPTPMNAPAVTPSPIPAAMNEKTPHMAPQKRRIPQGRRAEPTGAICGADGRHGLRGAPHQHCHPGAQAAPHRVDAAMDGVTAQSPGVERPEGGARPGCAAAIRARCRCSSSRGVASSTIHASLKRRADRR